MHELSITESVVQICAERAQGARVLSVVLQIGKLSAVLPDAVRFCFDLCAKETALEGAALKIIETPGVARCRHCNLQFGLDEPYGQCECGSVDLELLEGQELRIREMEVA